jgi:uncharacterized protein YrzB (UPF0473 family)
MEQDTTVIQVCQEDGAEQFLLLMFQQSEHRKETVGFTTILA